MVPSERKLPEIVADNASDPSSLSSHVRKLWCDLLDTATVRDDDDFFALGGNSVSATQLIAAVRNNVAQDVPIRSIFDYPIFSSFCDEIRRRAAAPSA